MKQKLVNLLFRENYSRTGPEGHKRLDFSIYSYEDLRKAYLKRLQVIHPDKIHNKVVYGNDDNSDHGRRSHCENDVVFEKKENVHSKEDLKKEFQELQSTWDRYDELSKSMMKARGDGVAANFTQFGVGCSFSDTEEERILRQEITDQACRGWFSSGLVSSGLTTETSGDENQHAENTKEISFTKQRKPLIDDAMFVSTESCGANDSSDASNRTDKTTYPRRFRRTLIPGIN